MDEQMIGENHFLSTEFKFRRSLIRPEEGFLHLLIKH